MFSGCTALPDSKKLQEASPSAGINIRVVSVPCHAWKCILTAISGGLGISKVPGCHLL